LQAGDLHGVWGGTTARERRAMAVVWRSGLIDTDAKDGKSSDREDSVDLPPVGAAMDRAELLRLVNAR